MRKLSKNTKSHKVDLLLADYISKNPLKPLRKKITLTELREMLSYRGTPHV